MIAWRVSSVSVTLLLLPLLWACSTAPSPEEQVRATMERARQAVEDGDLDALLELVSDDYRDGGGRDKRALRGMVAFYMRQNDRLYVFYQEKELHLASPSRAEVTAVVALASRPLGSGLDLSRVSADLLRLYVTFEREGGEFRVVGADWKAAKLSDFVLD